MSRIVKPGEEAPPQSVQKRTDHLKELAERKEIVSKIIKRFDDDAIWDGLQSREVPPELVEFVSDQLKDGFTFVQIRRQMGILRATDKSWRKIMSAIKQGMRIDGTAFLMQKAHEVQAMSDKLKEQIMGAFDEGIPVVMKRQDGSTYIEKLKGPTKELAMTVDTYNRLQQGFVKLGKDLGAFVDQEQKGGGGVTIVVQTNVPLPAQKDIDAHRKAQELKNRQLIEDAQIVTQGPGKDAPPQS